MGVANLFDKIHLSGFLAIVMKHIVNLKYFFDIRSGYYMFQYLMHEFFHIKDASQRDSRTFFSLRQRFMECATSYFLWFSLVR